MKRARTADGSHRGAVTAAVMAATTMQALDTTIANVALPHMQGSLGATGDQIAWVLTSYIVASAIFMPLTGYLAARFGRKRVFSWAVVGFTLASMLCGAAQSLAQIVAFRLLQGLCGAALVPLSQAILLDTYPREQHGSAMALWGVGVMVGPILGPTLGGYLTEYYDWRWVFYVNLPFGVLAWLGIAAFVAETDIDRGRRFDVFGFALLSLAIGALQLLLDRGQLLDWFESPEIVIEATLAGVALYMFVVHVFTHREPFLEPGLFRDRNFAAGLLLVFVVGLVLLSTVALLPPFLEHLLGYPVMTTGFVLAPRGVGTMLSMIVVGRLIRHVDPRLLLATGMLLTTLSLWLMTGFSLDVTRAAVVYSGFLQGVGLGFMFVPLTTASFATLPPRFRNEGAALHSLLRNIGSSIGISIVVAYLASNVQVNHSLLAEHATPFNQPLAAIAGGAWSIDSPAGLQALDGEVMRQAAALGYVQDFRLLMWVTLGAMPMILLLGRPARRARREPPAVEA